MLADLRLKFFLTVAHEKSFTKAAQVLGVTQPAVSQNIADLERSLGVRLFDRLRTEVVLTEQGKVFMPYALSLMNKSGNTEELFTRLPESVVRVSASEEIYSFVLAPVISKFSEIHPELHFKRSASDECELSLSLRPQSGSPFDKDDDVLAKLRVSAFMPDTKTGDLSAAREKISYFELLYRPSVSFSLTRTCYLFRQFLKDNII